MDFDLFERDSVKDLVMRGFTREFILEKMSVDVGYNASKVNGSLKGLDRMAYKIRFVRESLDDDALLELLSRYADGLPKTGVLECLGIHGERISLGDLFSGLGLGGAFRDADRRQRKGSMARGAIAKFGTDNVFKLQEYQDRAKQTRLEKYGGEYTLSSGSSLAATARETMNTHMQDETFAADVMRKRSETCMRNHGVDHPSKSSEIRMKAGDTMEKRYGVRFYAQLPEAREASRARMSGESGKAVREKGVVSCREKYGVDNYSQTEEFRARQSERMKSEDAKERFQKMRATCRIRYGVDYHSQTPEARERLSSFVRSHRDEFLERSRATSLARYGVEYFAQTEDAREAQSVRMRDPNVQRQIVSAKKRNGTLNTSAPEDYLYDRLVEFFGESDVIAQYSSSEYPFACDFYIKSRGLYIELNGYWTHGGHWFESDCENDVKRAEIWRLSDKPHYKTALYAWTELDVAKRGKAAAGNLNYVVFWDSSTMFDVDLWFAMGCPDGHDWDRMYSWLPERDVCFEESYPRLTGHRSFMTAARSACWRSFYHNELAAWDDNYSVKGGTLQSRLYSNRFHYLGKLPSDLTDNEILRGLTISGLVCGYTSFDNRGMFQFMDAYAPASIYDPCAGWGERMLTAGSRHVAYIGCDINPAAVAGHADLIRIYGLDGCHTVCGNSGMLDMRGGTHDVVFTCPPYGSREIYTDKGAENLDIGRFYVWWDSVVGNSISGSTRVFAYQIDQAHKDGMNAALLARGWHLADQIPVGCDHVSHMLRSRGVVTKKNFEEIQVFVRP